METEFIAISTAVEATQLSEKTLERFISAGYIKSTTDENDALLIDAADIRKTFGVEITIEEEAVPQKKAKQEEKPQTKKSKSKADSNSDRENLKDETSSYQDLPDEMLQKLVSLQDRLLDEKDATIKSQIQEIKWLRTRIEKLEDQGEKDKVLLLSSNQTINELIKIHRPGQGFFHRALSWIK